MIPLPWKNNLDNFIEDDLLELSFWQVSSVELFFFLELIFLHFDKEWSKTNMKEVRIAIQTTEKYPNWTNVMVFGKNK